MQVSNKFTRKVISQIITVYQWVLEINLEDIGIQLLIKQNKDPDDMLDSINAKLIEVCDNYLKDKNLWLDKYQLSTICAQLVTQAIDECEEPFWVSVKQSKALVKEYLETNKNKREALERIKKENEEFDRQYEQAKKENRQKANRTIDTTQLVEPQPQQTIQPKPKKRVTTTDDLAVDNFILPM